MARPVVSQQWIDAITSLVEAAEDTTAAIISPVPDRLFHFTDCVGLIGILEDRTLRASLATCLNDRSEVTYGVDLACKLFAERVIVPENFSLDTIGDALIDEAAQSGVYITSFCRDLNLAGQWLHYGRSGSGVAVGFYTDRLTTHPWTLFPITYKRDDQVAMIRSLITAIDQSLANASPALDQSQVEALQKSAETVAAQHLWRMSPRLKHPSFAAEHEWRLIAYEPKGPGAPVGIGPAGPTFFRPSGGRVIPYKEISFETLPAFEVVLGASCPMLPTDLGVLVLMDEKLKARLTVRTSDVPVR